MYKELGYLFMVHRDYRRMIRRLFLDDEFHIVDSIEMDGVKIQKNPLVVSGVDTEIPDTAHVEVGLYDDDRGRLEYTTIEVAMEDLGRILTTEVSEVKFTWKGDRLIGFMHYDPAADIIEVNDYLPIGI